MGFILLFGLICASVAAQSFGGVTPVSQRVVALLVGLSPGLIIYGLREAQHRANWADRIMVALAGGFGAILIAGAIEDNRIYESQKAHARCFSAQGRLHRELSGDGSLAMRREWLAAALKGDRAELETVGLEYSCRLDVRDGELMCPEHGKIDPDKLRPPGLLKYKAPLKLPPDLLAR